MFLCLTTFSYYLTNIWFNHLSLFSTYKRPGKLRQITHVESFLARLYYDQSNTPNVYYHLLLNHNRSWSIVQPTIHNALIPSSLLFYRTSNNWVAIQPIHIPWKYHNPINGNKTRNEEIRPTKLRKGLCFPWWSGSCYYVDCSSCYG